MKEWIKEIIKSEALAYLTLQSADKMDILPVTYRYFQGRLFFILPIIQAAEIELLQKYPYQYINISHEKNIGLFGRILIHDQKIDSDWKKYDSLLHTILENEGKQSLADLVQLQKAVIMEFVPSRIDFWENDELNSINMEIVL